MNRQLALNFGSPDERKPRTSESDRIGTDLREFQHEGVCLKYQLTRSRRRSIGLTVTDNGLRITAPSWTGNQQIEAAIRTKFNWIVRKLQELDARRQKLATDEKNWTFGGVIPYLGSGIELHADNQQNETQRGAVWFEGDVNSPTNGDKLWLPLPQDAQTQRVREMAQGWLQAQAKQCFEKRLKCFEAQCGLKPTSWRLSAANTRWGSCNSKGRIGLNWRLIHFEPAVIDYVIAHELAHLRELNHSDAFWKTLQSIYPDYLHGHRLLKSHIPGELPVL